MAKKRFEINKTTVDAIVDTGKLAILAASFVTACLENKKNPCDKDAVDKLVDSGTPMVKAALPRMFKNVDAEFANAIANFFRNFYKYITRTKKKATPEFTYEELIEYLDDNPRLEACMWAHYNGIDEDVIKDTINGKYDYIFQDELYNE